jgi:hypothetical protein
MTSLELDWVATNIEAAEATESTQDHQEEDESTESTADGGEEEIRLSGDPADRLERGLQPVAGRFGPDGAELIVSRAAG